MPNLTFLLQGLVAITVGRLLDVKALGFGATVFGTTAVVVSAQAVLSAYWLRHFRYGPAEWVWRCLTWWRLVPIRKRLPDSGPLTGSSSLTGSTVAPSRQAARSAETGPR
jgi:hypothetical protein